MKSGIQILTFLMLLISCGEGVFNVEGRSYEPKIVIDGYLHPGSSEIKIFFRRNLPLKNGDLFNPSELVLTNAQAALTDLTTSTVYPLTFVADSLYYTVAGAGPVIHYGRTYRLEVSATIDGQTLSASSETTTPNPGFSIDRANSLLDSLQYNAKDGLGESRKFRIVFNRAPGTDFYMTAAFALDASLQSFVYSPVNLFTDADSGDIVDDIGDLSQTQDFTLNTPIDAGQTAIEIEWFSTWFYGDYRVVLYAGDRNMRDFLLTFNDVQEQDGNLHEPVFHIDGDAIGVFGSATTDTVFIRVLRPQ